MSDVHKTRSRIAYESAERRIELLRENKDALLDLSITHLRAIPPLTNLPSLTSLTIRFTNVSDLAPLRDAPQLRFLDLSFSAVSDISPLETLADLEHLDAELLPIVTLKPISHLRSLRNLNVGYSHSVNLSGIGELHKLQVLALNNTSVSDLGALSDLSALKELRLSSTKIKDIKPLSSLLALESLDLSRTEISDLSPLAELKFLGFLALTNSQVVELDPLADVTSLIDASKRTGKTGLSFGGCPVRDLSIRRFASLKKYQRTARTINYLRGKQDLPLYVPKAQAEDIFELVGAAELTPVEGLPAPFDYALNASGHVVVISSSANQPLFPSPRHKQDHARRLDSCRIHAEDVIDDLSRVHNLRPEYLAWLKKYLTRLPVSTDGGNILLADTAARSLRNMFAAEADILPAPVASQLKTLLENYMGLRAFYPEVQAFQRDVREGRVTEPLSLDAVEAFATVVAKFTPDVFDRSVKFSIEEAGETPPMVPAVPVEDRQPMRTQPMPPPDMMGDLDFDKAHDIAQASTLNRLWKAVRNGVEIHKNVHAWIQTASELAPFAHKVLQFLRDTFPNGPPHP